MRLSELITSAIDLFYIKPVAKLMPRQTFRYAACGGLNMLLDAFYYFLIYNFVIDRRFFDLGFVVVSPHIVALLLVFPITFFNGFWLNRYVAFSRSPIPAGTQLFRYALSVAGALLINYACMKLFVEVFGVWPTPAKLLTTVVTIVYSYLAAKYFTFRNAAKE